MDAEPPIVMPDRWQRGRGTDRDPGNRFDTIRLEPGPDWNPAEEMAPTTRIVDDATRSVISRHTSPDLPFTASLNPYRGCEHGCSYCYARPYHEYLGLSSGLDFETVIIAKRAAPALLRAELSAPGWKPEALMMSGVTDCYQPVERRLRITRGCLEVLAELRHPVALITKNALVTRDIDLLQELARHHAVMVTISVTTLRQDLQQRLEPRASVPAARLAAIRALADAGIPVGVNIAPIIPGLTDHEMPAIAAAAADAGAQRAGYTVVRLPHAVVELFSAWLDHHEPLAKDKVLHRIAAVHGGTLIDNQFGRRMVGSGPHAQQIADLFAIATRRVGLNQPWPALSSAAFRPPGGRQTSIFAS